MPVLYFGAARDFRDGFRERMSPHGRERRQPVNYEQTLPPFQIIAAAKDFMTAVEMDEIIADHEPMLAQGMLGGGGPDTEVRRSEVVFLDHQGKYRWVYERIWEAAQEFNRRFFCVDIAGIQEKIQLARYDSAHRGFYTWHTDFADLAPRRKLSVSIQLSDAKDYEGGDLELMFRNEPHKAERTRGAFIAFPSFALHRVTPVTQGTRWSLVAWISGPRWR